MANTLLSGPAGSGKSQIARQLREDNPRLAIADFQSIYAAVTQNVRDATGRYPDRVEELLPLVEYTRRAVITGAVARELDVVVTNSDGAAERRTFLLGLLGPGAVERIVDPGEDVVRVRLSHPITGELSTDCEAAIARWYGRV